MHVLSLQGNPLRDGSEPFINSSIDGTLMQGDIFTGIPSHVQPFGGISVKCHKKNLRSENVLWAHITPQNSPIGAYWSFYQKFDRIAAGRSVH